MPFYYLRGKPFYYLNQSKDYVDLGFWNSSSLNGYEAYMTSEGRKVVKSLRYKSLEVIDESIVIAILEQANRVRGKGFRN